jgi:hypothetical protein
MPATGSIPVRAGAVLALGEFWTTPEHQAELMEREPRAAAAALRDDDLLAVSFHRSLDGTRMVNYSQIASVEAIIRIASLPGFSPERGYWKDIARNEYHTYDVAEVFVSGGENHGAETAIQGDFR